MGQFKPGVSGNPGGRPKVLSHVKSLARQYTDKAIETLVSIMENGKGPEAVRASEILLNRGWGTPSAEVPDPLTPEETARLAGAIGRELENNPELLSSMIAKIRDKQSEQPQPPSE